MTEKELQKGVLELAKLHDWRTSHFRTAQTARGAYVTPVQGDGKGFPDCVLVRGERLIFAELKQQKNYPSPEQRVWLAELDAVPGVEVYVWKPSDYPDKINEVLK